MRLVEVSAITKKVLVILAILLGAYITGLILKAPVKSIFLSLFPPKDLPTVSYGKLDPLEFTEINIGGQEIEYVLNTTTGKLPSDLPKTIPVYKYEPLIISYSAGEKAQEHAKILGFTEDMRVSSLSDTVYRWEDVRHGGVLEINLTTGVVELTTPLGTNGSFFPAGKLNRAGAIEQAQDLLKQINRFDYPLYKNASLTDIKVSLGKFRLGKVIKADSTLEAQIAKVDFFRKINDYPILGPSAAKGLIQIHLRDYQSITPQLNYPILRIYPWKIDPDDTATYPITPISQVWKEITDGNGVVSSVLPSGYNPFDVETPNNINKIVVNSIYIAYYDNTTPQTYMQPIYVFEGNYTTNNNASGKITIYYPAISQEYLNIDSENGLDEPYLPQL